MGARELYSKGSSSLLEIEVDSGNHQKLIVVGDLHGQINDLLWILHIHGLPNPAGAQYLFNGDFVDRGEYGMEVLTLLCTMKCLWPNSVHLNRGNHETLNANIAYGFAPECIHKYSNEMMQICQVSTSPEYRRGGADLCGRCGRLSRLHVCRRFRPRHRHFQSVVQ